MSAVSVTHDDLPPEKRLAVSLQRAKEPVDALVAFQTYAVDRSAEVGETYDCPDNADAPLTERGRALGTASLDRVKARRAARRS
jgi:hypothetical protein